MVALVEGGEAITPSATHIDEVHRLGARARSVPGAGRPDRSVRVERGGARESARGRARRLRLLSREFILQLHANPNISLGGGYRGYPGFSAAQVRQKLGVGR